MLSLITIIRRIYPVYGVIREDVSISTYSRIVHDKPMFLLIVSGCNIRNYENIRNLFIAKISDMRHE